MSRKHNVKHRRSKSNYPKRLAKRGQTNSSVRMTDLATLRRRAGVKHVGISEDGQ